MKNYYDEEDDDTEIKEDKDDFPFVGAIIGVIVVVFFIFAICR